MFRKSHLIQGVSPKCQSGKCLSAKRRVRRQVNSLSSKSVSIFFRMKRWNAVGLRLLKLFYGGNKLVRFNVLVLYLRAEVEATLVKQSKHDSITINGIAYNTVVSIGILKIAIKKSFKIL